MACLRPRQWTWVRARRCHWLACLAFLALVLAAAVEPFQQRWLARCALKLPPVAYTGAAYRGDTALARAAGGGRRVGPVHVTKEYGPASMGGLGTMLTALVAAQASSSPPSSSSPPRVIMPYYAYLRNATAGGVERFGTVPVRCADRYGRGAATIAAEVGLLRWPVAAAGAGPERGPTAAAPAEVLVYLIGRGSARPFERAFEVGHAHDIYSAPPPLPQEWRDLYFAQAAAALLARLAREPGAAPPVAHLHGATNAMVAPFLRSRAPGVPVVYTLHDYLDEVEYSNRRGNLARFLAVAGGGGGAPSLAPAAVARHSACGRFFPSAVGIRHADVATFVSRAVGRAIIAGRFPFQSNSRIVPALLAQNEAGAFAAITNGVDRADPDRDPFLSRQLVAGGAAFPVPGRAGAFAAAKRRAKAHLLEHHRRRFPGLALDEPLFLFVGRFQHAKGCGLFPALLAALEAEGAGHFVALGTRNDYPHPRLLELAAAVAGRFTLVDDPALQPSLGPWLRMAADVAFVPSLAESFGLVAAEGLRFGSPVLSTGAGGLREFLRDGGGGGDGPEAGNAHLFELGGATGPGRRRLTEADRGSCAAAARRAVAAWRRRAADPDLEERSIARWVAQAQALAWDRPGGPADQYARVYAEAAERKRATG